MDAGAIEVHAYITHGVLSGEAVKRIEASSMTQLIITDSVGPSIEVTNSKKIRVIPTAPMFAQAILNIWGGTSVSSLFNDDSLAPVYEGMYPSLI